MSAYSIITKCLKVQDLLDAIKYVVTLINVIYCIKIYVCVCVYIYIYIYIYIHRERERERQPSKSLVTEKSSV